jgi:GNAT superfamily N-acetyltransferase
VPLAQEAAAVSAPWRAAGIDPATVYYFGESVLLPAWRGQGLGHRFFDEREAQARRLGRFDCTSFCAVERADDDPRCPTDYRPLHAFWHARGYGRRPGIACTMHWREVGGGHEVPHRLGFWSRPLDANDPDRDGGD